MTLHLAGAEQQRCRGSEKVQNVNKCVHSPPCQVYSAEIVNEPVFNVLSGRGGRDNGIAVGDCCMQESRQGCSRKSSGSKCSSFNALHSSAEKK